MLRRALSRPAGHLNTVWVGSEHILEHERTVEEGVDDELRTSPDTVTSPYDFDMSVDGLIAQAEDSPRFPVALSLCDERQAFPLASGKLFSSGTPYPFARAVETARRFEDMEPENLGYRTPLVTDITGIVGGEADDGTMLPRNADGQA